MMQDAECTGNYLNEFSSDVLQRIDALANQVDGSDYRAFVAKCNEHRPWIWKDPRLWLTIRFWQRFLDLDDCRFILLTRGHVQTWLSSTLRRRITTCRSAKDYEERIRESIVNFMHQNHQRHLELRYEDLIQKREESIAALNGFLDTHLTVDDLKSVYRKPLYSNRRTSALNHLKAMPIDLKNHSEPKELSTP